MKSVTVHAPASVSNLNCGFDILGMALAKPYDVITLTMKDEPGIEIHHDDPFGLPLHPAKNIAGVALQACIKAAGYTKGFHLRIQKNIKPGSGIGSSAASAAGVVVAANELLGNPFSKHQLVQLAMEGEVFASGSKHADNLAPCIYGGLVLIRDTATLDIIPVSTPPLYITVVHPQLEVKTSYARSILPTEIPLKQAVIQWANVAGLITGFLQKDYALISRSLTDVIVEPVRSRLIPGFDEVKKKCMQAGALGGGISGSGPSLFMLSETNNTALQVADAMKQVYEQLGIEYKIYVTTIGEGVKLVNE